MKNRKMIPLLCALLALALMIAACRKSAPEETAAELPDSYEEILARDDLVILDNWSNLINGQLWTAFLDQTERGKDAAVTIVRFTDEGDPIYFTLTYSKDLYRLRSDYTRDHYGSLGVEERKYRNLQTFAVGSEVYTILTNTAFADSEEFAEALTSGEKYFPLLIQQMIEPEDGAAGREELPFSAQMIRTNGWHDDAVYPRLTYIGSADALNRYFEENQDDYDFSHRDTVYSDMTIGFVDAVAGYDEAFFADHALLLVLLEEGSGSVRHEVASVTREASGSAAEVTVEITRFVPEVGTDDMAEWHAVIEVPRTVEETDAFVVKMK